MLLLLSPLMLSSPTASLLHFPAIPATLLLCPRAVWVLLPAPHQCLCSAFIFASWATSFPSVLYIPLYDALRHSLSVHCSLLGATLRGTQFIYRCICAVPRYSIALWTRSRIAMHTYIVSVCVEVVLIASVCLFCHLWCVCVAGY